MFKFAKNREVLWPVEVSSPVDGGSVDKFVVKICYKLLTQSEISTRVRDEMDMMRHADDIDKSMASISETELAKRNQDLMDHIVGWEDIADADSGEPLPFTPENVAAVLDLPYARPAIGKGLLDASRGAPVKN